ncbi:MAG: hypothetical protein KAZ88_12765 [Acidimicrobiia bacterium]|nr:hypothetical protein [Acidimicrobiia bacterium]
MAKSDNEPPEGHPTGDPAAALGAAPDVGTTDDAAATPMPEGGPTTQGQETDGPATPGETLKREVAADEAAAAKAANERLTDAGESDSGNPGAGEPGGLTSEHGERSHRSRLLSLIAVIAVILSPGVFGIADKAFLHLEQPTPADFPEMSLESLRKPDTYAALDRAISDRIPMLAQSRRVRAVVDRDVLRSSNNPVVVVGKGDWLFQDRALEAFCAPEFGKVDDEMPPNPPQSSQELADNITLMSAIAAAAGREFAYVMPPTKASIYPEKMSWQAREIDSCGADLRAGFREILKTKPIPGFYPLWDTVSEAAKGATTPLYLIADPHWRPQGATLMAETMVDAFAPDLWDQSAIQQQEPVELVPGGYTNLGLPGTETVVPLTAARPGVKISDLEELEIDGQFAGVTEVPGAFSVAEDESYLRLDASYYDVADQPFRTTEAEATGNGNGAELIDGNTLFIYDSFSFWMPPLIAPYFSHLDYAYVYPTRRHTQVNDLMKSADRLILGLSEMQSFLFATDGWPMTTMMVGTWFDDLPRERISLHPLLVENDGIGYNTTSRRWQAPDQTFTLGFEIKDPPSNDYRLLTFLSRSEDQIFTLKVATDKAAFDAGDYEELTEQATRSAGALTFDISGLDAGYVELSLQPEAKVIPADPEKDMTIEIWSAWVMDIPRLAS